jgi:hypothetical protein
MVGAREWLRLVIPPTVSFESSKDTANGGTRNVHVLPRHPLFRQVYFVIYLSKKLRRWASEGGVHPGRER